MCRALSSSAYSWVDVSQSQDCSIRSLEGAEKLNLGCHGMGLEREG